MEVQSVAALRRLEAFLLRLEEEAAAAAPYGAYGAYGEQEDAAASVHPDTPPLAGLLADFDAEAERCAARGGARGDGGAEVGAGCGGDGAASAQDKAAPAQRTVWDAPPGKLAKAKRTVRGWDERSQGKAPAPKAPKAKGVALPGLAVKGNAKSPQPKSSSLSAAVRAASAERELRQLSLALRVAWDDAARVDVRVDEAATVAQVLAAAVKAAPELLGSGAVSAQPPEGAMQLRMWDALEGAPDTDLPPCDAGAELRSFGAGEEYVVLRPEGFGDDSDSRAKLVRPGTRLMRVQLPWNGPGEHQVVLCAAGEMLHEVALRVCRQRSLEPRGMRLVPATAAAVAAAAGRPLSPRSAASTPRSPATPATEMRNRLANAPDARTTVAELRSLHMELMQTGGGDEGGEGDKAASRAAAMVDEVSAGRYKEYPVIKINRYGTRQRRIMAIDSERVYNLPADTPAATDASTASPLSNSPRPARNAAGNGAANGGKSEGGALGGLGLIALLDRARLDKSRAPAETKKRAKMIRDIAYIGLKPGLPERLEIAYRNKRSRRRSYTLGGGALGGEEESRYDFICESADDAAEICAKISFLVKLQQQR